MTQLTTDTFFNGRIQVKQNRSGYRFSIDPVLLAHHAKPGPGDTVLDLGTGCGIIPLILAYHHPAITIWGIEIQPDLAHIAEINVKENQMKGRIHILCEDIKSLTNEMISKPVNLIVSNPPYRKANSGRINPDLEKAIARHEIRISLPEVIEIASRMLSISGRFITIYPAERMTDILMQMRESGLEPKYIRMIHSKQDTPAKLVLIEAMKGGHTGTSIGPPLITYQNDGSYTDEVEKMFSPDQNP